MKTNSTEPTEENPHSSVGLNKKTKQFYCSICNAALTPHSTCPVCKKTTQRLCPKCGATTPSQFHKKCFQKLEWVIFQTKPRKPRK